MKKRNYNYSIKLNRIGNVKVLIIITIVFIILVSYIGIKTNAYELTELQADMADSKNTWYYFDSETDQLIANSKETDFLTKIENSGVTTFSKVPVPKGFSASQIDSSYRQKYVDDVEEDFANYHITNEVTAKYGFVIYSGNVNWSEVLTGEDERNVSMPITTSLAVEYGDIGDFDVVEDYEDSIELIDENEFYSEQDEVDDEEIEIEETKIIVEIDEMNQTDETDEILDDEITTFAQTHDFSQEEINIFNLQKSTNQFVFVPITVDNLVRQDKNGKLWSKLRGQLLGKDNWTALTGNLLKINNKFSGNSCEPRIIGLTTTQSRMIFDKDSYRYAKQITGSSSRTELSEKVLNREIITLRKRIENLRGVYVGRYELTGSSRYPSTKKMTSVRWGLSWYEAMNDCQKLEVEQDVKTTMITRAIWDTMCNWFATQEGTINGRGSEITYSEVVSYENFGNYYTNVISYVTSNNLNETNLTTANEDCKFDAGSSSLTSVNNIYDVRGNVWEWCQSARSNVGRMLSGGAYDRPSEVPMTGMSVDASPSREYSDYGTRAILY